MILEQLNKSKIDKSYQESVTSEKPIRSVVKAVSWRVLGTVDTMVVSWFVAGDFTLAFKISAIDFVTKFILYFFHERAWNAIKWGK